MTVIVVMVFVAVTSAVVLAATKKVKVDGHCLEDMDMEAHRQLKAPHLGEVMVVMEDSHQMKVKEDGHRLKEMMETQAHRQPMTAHLEKVMVATEHSRQTKVKEVKVVKVYGHQL